MKSFPGKTLPSYYKEEINYNEPIYIRLYTQRHTQRVKERYTERKQTFQIIFTFLQANNNPYYTFVYHFYC